MFYSRYGDLAMHARRIDVARIVATALALLVVTAGCGDVDDRQTVEGADTGATGPDAGSDAGPEDSDNQCRGPVGEPPPPSDRDDRLDPYRSAITDRQRGWARATAVMAQPSALTETDDGEQLRLDTFCYQFGDLCEDVRYGDQPNISGGGCTSFLVAPDVVVTAGHCTDMWACDQTRFVFDYGYYQKGDDPTAVDPDDVYQCEEIVAENYQKQGPMDYAVVRLDRPVDDRQPLELRQSGRVELDDRVVIIGYPFTLPVKLDTSGVVRSISESAFGSTNKVFGGNSGSPAINLETGRVEGIMPRAFGGDYRRDADRACRRPNYSGTCAPDTAEECNRASSIYTDHWRDAVEEATE
jgi:V8-like Glu-specific endopeptidase